MPRAVVSARRDAGGGLFLVALDVDAELARAYVAPGQYVAVRGERESGYFVLASDVGARPWELLVRNAGSAADLLVSRDLGTTVDVSLPLGAGFPREGATGRPLVVAVVASALGVARALVDARIADGAAGDTHLLVGVRAATDVPLVEEVASWAERGVDVVLCLSREELEHHREILPRAARLPGYVQQVLARGLEGGRFPGAAARALVVAAGPESMLADLRTLAASRALELLTNA